MVWFQQLGPVDFKNWYEDGFYYKTFYNLKGKQFFSLVTISNFSLFQMFSFFSTLSNQNSETIPFNLVQ